MADVFYCKLYSYHKDLCTIKAEIQCNAYVTVDKLASISISFVYDLQEHNSKS